jgi:hypothetical protein
VATTEAAVARSDGSWFSRLFHPHGPSTETAAQLAVDKPSVAGEPGADAATAKVSMTTRAVPDRHHAKQ